LGNLEARLVPMVVDIGNISRISINFISGWTFDCRNHFVIIPLAIDQTIYALPGFFHVFMLLLKYWL
jgi:hypothetical protein